MGSLHIDMTAVTKAAALKGHALKDRAKEDDFMPKPKTPMNLVFKDVSCYVPAHFEIPGLMSKESISSIQSAHLIQYDMI